MTYVFTPHPVATIPVAGGGDFPVHRIYCVGRNYAAHAREMGHDPDRDPPFFFQKNPDDIVTDGRFPYPRRSSDVHHEIELAVALAEGGRDIASERALDHVFGYAVALDMTRRDLQDAAKKLARPWEVAKAFDASALCGPIVPASRIGHPTSGAIRLDVNGQRRQDGDLSQMIWNVPEIIAELSTLFTLRSGDVILTGTPAGVGPVVVGDRLQGHVDGIGDLEVVVTG